MRAKGGQAIPLGELSGGRISDRLSRQARSGRCRSSAARARTLILNGFFPNVMDAEAVAFLTARAALFFTPDSPLVVAAHAWSWEFLAVSREANGRPGHDGNSVLRFVLRPTNWNHWLCFFRVCGVFSGEPRASLAQCGQARRETGWPTPRKGRPTDREPASWPSETGGHAARSVAGARL